MQLWQEPEQWRNDPAVATVAAVLPARGKNGQRATRRGGGVHPTQNPPNVQRDPGPGRERNPGAGPGNLGAGPGRERSPGATQGRERRAGPKEGSPRNPGAGQGDPEAVLGRERNLGAGLTGGDLGPRRTRTTTLNQSPGAGPGANPGKERSPGATQGRGRSPGAGPGRERSPGAGLTGGGPGRERSPVATQERERRAGTKEGSPERARSPGAGPGNPGTIPRGEKNPGAAPEREERLAALTEADPAVPGTMQERRLVRLPIIGPRVPRDAMHPPVCMHAMPGRHKCPTLGTNIAGQFKHCD